MKKYTFLAAIYLLFSFAGKAALLSPFKCASMADSADALHYHINLDITDFTNRKISGYTDVLIKAKVSGLNKVRLDLLKLPVSLVSLHGVALTYVADDSTLTVTLDKNYNLNDTFTLHVEYAGTPQSDKTWGGFYFSGVYAFNLGVGFSADPHTFGRAWFPCFDNFTDRATYSFSITTDSSKRAVCNGLPTGESASGATKTYNWKLDYEIPTYLACVAVAPYALVQDTYIGINGNKPIILAAVASDTTNLKSSFINLKNALAAFEHWYGPYRFNRVGYSLVPFSGGAMEHATNIAYPLFGVDGGLTYETLYAHELSHMWWGDNTTCRTAEDMWLNEGFASYSEKVFLEYVYGRSRYMDEVRSNHFNVLRTAHLRDGQPWPVSGVPHAYTYGDHVYKKGADIVHTLRSYFGDSIFYKAVHEFMENHKYSDVSTEDLKGAFKKYIEDAALNSFFDNWVYTAGFPAFFAYIKEVKPTVGNKYDCKIRLHQQLRFTDKLYTNVFLKVTFVDKDCKSQTFSVRFSEKWRDTTLTADINPIMVIVDRAEDLSDAVTENELLLKNSGTYTANWGLMTVNLPNTIADSALLRIEHHWTGPVEGVNPFPGLFPSGSRYWRVDANWLDSAIVPNATITYDGRIPGDYSYGWLDNSLIKQTEDSLVLLWRENPEKPWKMHPDYTKIMGQVKDKTGTIKINRLYKGEYALAMYDHRLGTAPSPAEGNKGLLEAYPNPTKGLVTVKFDDIYQSAQLTVTDLLGRSIASVPLYAGQNFTELDTAGWKKGIYYISLSGNSVKVLVE